MNEIWKGLGKAAIAAATLFCAQAASAQTAGTSNGTAANTTVTNSVSVNYKIATVAQTQVTSNVTFKVDRKVNVVVAEVGTTDTQVVPNATNQVTTFTVLNASNAIIDINLTAALDLATGPRGQAQSFTATNVRIFRDANANGTFDSGTDVDITANPFFDEVEVTTDGSATNGLRTVFIVADIPSATNNQVEVVSLTAQARAGGTASTLGAAFTNDDSTPDDKDVVQNVFADGDGPATDDASRDGKHSDDDAYLVTVTALTVAKTVEVISDPFNGSGGNQKPIPGAVVRYCVLMTNNGVQDATDVALSDVVPAELTYATGTIKSGAGAGMTCAGATTDEDDDATAGGGDGDGFDASYSAGSLTVAGLIGTLPAGHAAAVRFNATVK